MLRIQAINRVLSSKTIRGRAGAVLRLALIAALASACAEPEELTFRGPFHVRFTEARSEVVENYKDPFGLNFNRPIEIQVHLASPTLNNTTIVEFEVSGTAVENEDYIILGSQNRRVLISVGEHFGKIEVYPLNNFDETGDKFVRFTITSVNNDLDIGLGVNGVNGRTHTLTLRDDDCLVDLRKFEGLWQFDQNQGEFVYPVEIIVDYRFNNRIFMLNYTGLDPRIFAFANLDLCRREFIISEQNLGGFGGSQGGRTRSDGTGTFDQNVESLSFSYSYDLAGRTVRSVVATKIQE
jgi:hypothetical protein